MTQSKFTQLGQIIILILIQVGELGIITLSSFFIFLIVGYFSIFDRDIIQETLTQTPIKNLASFLKLILIFTFSIEIIGATILAYRFLHWFPMNKSIYYSIFHSISAFCYAGFALFSNSF